MTIRKAVFAAMISFAIGILSVLGYQSYQQSQQKPSLQPARKTVEKTVVDITTLQESIEQSNELSTAKYLYTDSIAVTDQNILNVFGIGDVAMPFTEANYILEFDGVIKAGYDLNDADVSLQGGRTVVVTLPEEIIVSHETSDVRRVWEMQNISNPLHAGEESKWIEGQKEQMEERAISLGLYDEAKQNAKTTFESLFASAIPEEAILEIRFTSPEGSSN